MMAASSGPGRHFDSGASLADYADRIMVVCPKCGGRALVLPKLDRPQSMPLLTDPRRLVCAGCAAVADWAAETRDNARIYPVLGGPEDPFFGRPLWLRTSCVGQVLWAYNERHIDDLAEYVAAPLRESRAGSGTWGMFPRLPRWMKRADNRREVLAGLETLRALAARTATH